MGRLAQTEGLTDVQQEMLAAVREFVDAEIIPVANELEHADEYPTKIVEQMKEMGIFGLMIPEEYGGLGESLLTYALVVEEIARGWMSVSGIINTHFIVAYMLLQHGTDEQRQNSCHEWLPEKFAVPFRCRSPGAVRTYRQSPHAGTRSRRLVRPERSKDVADQWGIGQPRGRPCEDRRGCRQRLPQHDDVPHREGTGIRRSSDRAHDSRQDREDGYKGVDTTELVMDGLRLGQETVLGGETGRGFYQMMDGIEVGRVNVAARACGVAQRAFELAIDYAQQRETFGKQIAQHQAVMFRLADMATKVESAHQMMIVSARKKDSGERNDLEAGMAKYLASEFCRDVVEDSFRIHGGYGYSKEYEIERLYREAPMLLIGEGTADIQRMIIGRRLLEDYKRRS